MPWDPQTLIFDQTSDINPRVVCDLPPQGESYFLDIWYGGYNNSDEGERGTMRLFLLAGDHQDQIASTNFVRQDYPQKETWRANGHVFRQMSANVAYRLVAYNDGKNSHFGNSHLRVKFDEYGISGFEEMINGTLDQLRQANPEFFARN